MYNNFKSNFTSIPIEKLKTNRLCVPPLLDYLEKTVCQDFLNSAQILYQYIVLYNKKLAILHHNKENETLQNSWVFLTHKQIQDNVYNTLSRKQLIECTKFLQEQNLIQLTKNYGTTQWDNKNYVRPNCKLIAESIKKQLEIEGKKEIIPIVSKQHNSNDSPIVSKTHYDIIYQSKRDDKSLPPLTTNVVNVVKSLSLQRSCVGKTKSEEIRAKQQHLDSLGKSIHSLPKRKDISCPEKYERFIELWEKHCMTKPMARNTKQFQKIIDSLRALTHGKLFEHTDPCFDKIRTRAFTFEEYEKSLLRFIKARYSKEHAPKDKGYLQHMTLVDFLFDVRSMYDKSQFYKFLYAEPILLCEEKIDTSLLPLVNALQKMYGKEACGNADTVYTEQEKKEFINAVLQYDRFLKSVNLRMIPAHIDKEKYKAGLLYRAVSRRFTKIGMLRPKHFCNSEIFNVVLPAYLKEQAIISSC